MTDVPPAYCCMQEIEHGMLQLASDLLRLCDPNKLQHLYDGSNHR